MSDRIVDADEPPQETNPSAGAEIVVAVLFGAAIVAALGLAVVYLVGGQPQLEGALLAVVLGGIGGGMAVWANRFLPGEEAVEDRPALPSAPADVDAFATDFHRGQEAIGRRRLLARLLAGAFGAFALALVFPIRSLGPRPGRGLFTTAWADGRRLVTADGSPVLAEALAVGSVITVWPEDNVGDADAPTLLINTGEDDLALELATVGPLVAYSKLCTHTGCPVGLYQAEEQLLLCPCHQSTFAVLDGARPIFGPAARALPQLPIGVDDEGYLVATGDFEFPVGPGFFDRGREPS